MSNDNHPALADMGANTSKAASSINLDTSGTVGPDYLGQETVNVNGHPKDRPGVLSRLPENTSQDPEGHVHPDIAQMDTGEELPVLLKSDMRADMCEGVQGSYTEIVEGECARCGYDRLRVSVHTMSGEHHESCNACGARQTHSGGYSMPKTDNDRAKRERESGQKLVEILNKSVYDMEQDTGFGAYISIVGNNSVHRMQKDEISKIYFALANNGDLDLVDEFLKNVTNMEEIELRREITQEFSYEHHE